MTGSGYAVVDLDDLPWSRHGMDAAWATLSAPLGTSELTVDGARLAAEATVELPPDPEQLLVSLEGAIGIDGLDGPVAHPGVSRVPAGVAGALYSVAPAQALVVGAAVEPDPEATPKAMDLEAADFVVPETSDVATAFLTEVLGCAGMKVNARRLEPGQVVPYHTEGDQEELFVPVRGPASMRIDDTVHSTPPGTVVRVAPDVPRSAVNDGDTDALWVMMGAPPTGGPTGWDPGATVLE